VRDTEQKSGEEFLSRWSRLKQETREAAPPPASAQSAAPAEIEETSPRELPPIESLTKDSDYTVFFQPKIDEDVRRAALKKLFSDPHFNVMDGLDTYIGDYSKGESLPVEMLAQLRSAQKIFKWARNEPEDMPEEGEKPTEQVAAPVTLELVQPVADSEPTTTPPTVAEARQVTLSRTTDADKTSDEGKL
jgi:hypothetical protein